MYSMLLLALALCVGYTLGVQVETKYGTVEGETIELIDLYHAGISVNTFLSIPFARPPVDELRFAVSIHVITVLDVAHVVVGAAVGR